MTVSRHKRRLSTSAAAVASIAGLVLAVGLGVVGGIAIYHTQDGEVLGSDVPEDRFPDTPTGLVAVVDGAGTLTSVAVFALRPGSAADGGDGAGGSLVPIPVSADVSGGFGDARAPLDAAVAAEGGQAVPAEVSSLLGLTIDVSAVLTEAELAALLAPLGDATVQLPVAVSGSDGVPIAEAGVVGLDGAGLARLLATDTPDLVAADAYDVDVAAWRAIAAAIGGGLDEPLGSPPIAPPGTAAVPPPTFEEALHRLTAGAVAVARLHERPVSDLADNPDGVDVVALDRPEVVTLFGHVAPSRLVASNPGYNLQVRSAFGDDQLVDGLTRYDLSYAATAALLGLEANVLSVDTTADEAGSLTVVEVSDESLATAARGLSDVFGPVEVRVAERRIVGIDAVVTLGTQYLNLVASSAARVVPQDSSAPGGAPVDTSDVGGSPPDDTNPGATG